MPSREEIFDKVKSALVDALGVDEDDVTPGATMVGDLGAESIDFLDIVFRLEKAFNIKISRGELFPEDVLSSSEFVADGKVTLIAGVTADATSKVKAGELVNFVAQQVGGKGGGRADMAQAGGTDPSALPAALAAVGAWVGERVG
jgi:acyl carrier protein